jgi:hypothetical protein
MKKKHQFMEQLAQEVLGYADVVLSPGKPTLTEWRMTQIMLESVENSRYSVEVNYRSKSDEVLEGYAKIVLGYVSAAVKQRGYHVKHVYTEKPIRILISSRNWDDGEWCCVVTYNPEHKCFVLSKGFYSKQHVSVHVQSSHKCSGDSAAEIAKDAVNTMHSLKGVPDRYQDKLKPVPLKRGPKS